MSRLINARWEAFAQALAKGLPATQAYSAAGYKPNDGNCIRLKGNERIGERVRELQGEAAVKTIINIQSITSMFLEDRQLAYSTEQSQAAQNATEKLAKLYGMSFEAKEPALPQPTYSGNVVSIDVASVRQKGRG